MTDLVPAQFITLIPPHFTPLQNAIARALVQFGCRPRIGAGPRLGNNTSNDNATPDCRVCGASLAGELTLRHVMDGRLAGRTQTSPACHRTFHLECTVDWAESNLRRFLPITCPQDRQQLIPSNVATQLRVQFEIPDPPPDHVIRNIDAVIPFWRTIHPLGGTGDNWNLTVEEMAPETILQLAASGRDVGFISAEVLPLFPVYGELLDIINGFRNQLKLRRKDGKFPGRVYANWVYVEMGRELIEGQHAEGFHEADICWVPFTDAAFRIIRKYILGIMGKAYKIEMDAQQQVRISHDILSPREVVQVHAEKEVRLLMRRMRNRIFPPETVIWFWPWEYPDGIAMGGILPGLNHPISSYNLQGINIGHSNDDRYRELIADPVAGAAAKQNNDALVAQFRQGILPHGFPPGSGWSDLNVRVPLYQVDAQGQTTFTPVDVNEIPNMQVPTTRHSVTQQALFPQHAGLNDLGPAFTFPPVNWDEIVNPFDDRDSNDEDSSDDDGVVYTGIDGLFGEFINDDPQDGNAGQQQGGDGGNNGGDDEADHEMLDVDDAANADNGPASDSEGSMYGPT